MSKHNRIFPRNNYSTGVTAWYFKSREGLIGPFTSEEAAVWALDEYLKQIVHTKELVANAEGLGTDSQMEPSAALKENPANIVRLN